MSDTPETDANTWSDSCEGILYKVVSAEIAKRLERERDKAKIDAEQLANRLTALELESTSELARLERERDEARENLDQEMKFHHRTHSELIQTQCEQLDNDETNYRLKMLEYKRERDEARQEVKLLKAILDLIKKDVS